MLMIMRRIGVRGIHVVVVVMIRAISVGAITGMLMLLLMIIIFPTARFFGVDIPTMLLLWMLWRIAMAIIIVMGMTLVMVRRRRQKAIAHTIAPSCRWMLAM